MMLCGCKRQHIGIGNGWGYLLACRHTNKCAIGAPSACKLWLPWPYKNCTSCICGSIIQPVIAKNIVVQFCFALLVQELSANLQHASHRSAAPRHFGVCLPFDVSRGGCQWHCSTWSIKSHLFHCPTPDIESKVTPNIASKVHTPNSHTSR